MIELRAGRLDAPLFLFSGKGCDPYELAPLAGLVDRPAAVFSVKFWEPINATSPTPSTVAEMADAAIDAIRRVQPAAPYSLAGYSFGGLVAFEAARRLQGAGSAVHYLALIDAPYGARYWPKTLWVRTKWRRLLNQLGTARRLPFKDAVALARAEAAKLALKLASRLGIASTIHLPSADEQALLMDRCGRALAQYRPEAYFGPVTLFKAVPGADWICDLTALWSRQVRALETRPIASDHFDLLGLDGAGRELAKAFNDSLDAADIRVDRKGAG